ncbi:cyclophane-forming radical SAM/SPASM peptide maturase GrrM/OscB [Mesorhizobium sp. WSM3859]|uniref:cyclophane-forming radical SAM/SPASM peptide maturase GrrM/OscB n=1 Tax=Mesorhizobium sp. WSM3859 TaxID=2029402 RepID=UPI000BAEADE8|nr:cyclophane-forming radical SAM/SPASM peptide maturase GrrM/OscB [Mesorhizobium sp. WSM3859]PBC08184.1 GRRM system radical SAM/SPASM domain protein [Mesorhizobium sp. WSM3859]
MEQFLKAGDFAGVTRLLIMQPTAFCNVDCDYCYLPHRGDRRVMSHETVAAAAHFIFEANLQARDFTVVWHAGEPLVVPPDWYAEAFARVAAEAPMGSSVPHAIQTNGMLINDAWCDLFLAHGVRVGVSIDGPAFLHDARRRTRSGGGTHAKALRGLRLLKARGVALHVICVITNASLSHGRELMEFFRDEGIEDVGFNIEEVEGANAGSSLARPGVVDDFRAFFETVLVESDRMAPLLRVREYRNVLAMLRHPGLGSVSANSQNMPFAMVTVGVGGELFTFSPELAGLSSKTYDDFIIGRLPDATLASVLKSASFEKLRSDIWQGIALCHQSCRYFTMCLGGAPVNKLSECGTFIATETLACKLTQQVITDVSLERLEKSLASPAA